MLISDHFAPDRQLQLLDVTYFLHIFKNYYTVQRVLFSCFCGRSCNVTLSGSYIIYTWDFT